MPLIKSKTSKVYKNKKLNNGNFGDYNLNDYQAFLHLISKIAGVDEMGKYLQPTELKRIHTLNAKEFSEQFNLELDSVYTVLKRVAKRLTQTSITLEQPDLFETWHIALCSMSKYNHKEGSLTVEFTEHIMPYLAQVKKRFVLYNLKEVANFGSLYTTRLYELIQEFKETGYIVKSLLQLRDIFAVGCKYSEYKNFKAKTFLHAVNEINVQYDMGLTFEEIKQSRKVVAIKFSFNRTIVINGVDRKGNPRNTYIKPKRKKVIKIEKPKENLTQADLPL
jgi:plasmid replication initiation protein